jgi:hypothetical protein
VLGKASSFYSLLGTVSDCMLSWVVIPGAMKVTKYRYSACPKHSSFSS